ncbi:hypothetical protein JAB5_02350 [Janthinobacterium sp. HH103]|uniref:type II toxin-antitoxin system RelE/ParE family toxin n=1 Tax=unclassified Janthinobacterium TaxID=2610881 RepID=UPI00087403F9|nr:MULTISPECIES: type II toxin-antitoxin system RelE/ParE family toxin [unclassified Janthinobacterium]OEZ64573.1 hypothetical protein JAB2_41070 [Janthinobacterium sp. HH100]OEZ87923.1 hypothetical protein JAB5_02140 [Janthinobacterium sp. HH103]OEZ87944.1 hypothetical protein JAB5_02350 [Janthinobacterium sp. HH103]QOU72865.1 Putative toxin HigB2 [Janthinobacterium sp. HH102]
MNAPKTWPVTFHDDFDAEFDALPIDVQDELLASADALSKLGPAAGRPHVGTLKHPKHPNMKELRFKGNNGAEVWRAVFAFDTRREAVILVAAAKQGIGEDRFDRDLLFKANARYEQHLKNLTTATARQGKGRR